MENINNSNHNVVVNFHDSVIERDGQHFKLDLRQVQLLEFFLAHPDENISRQTLSEQVWQSEFTSDDTINKTVSSLRKALSSQRNLFITTIPKVGYRFSVGENVSFKVRREPQVETVTAQQTDNNLAAKHHDLDKNTASNNTAPNNTIANKAKLDKSKFIIAAIVIIGVAFVYQLLMTTDKQPNTAQYSGMESTKKNAATSEQQEVQPPVNSIKLVLLAIEDITVADNSGLSTDFTEILREQIFSDLSVSEGISIIDSQRIEHLNKSSQPHLLLKSKLMLLDGTENKTVKLALQLVDSQSGRRKFSTMIDATVDAAVGARVQNNQSLLEHLSKQVGAAVRLGLNDSALFKTYASALGRLSHVEIEQLMEAEKHVTSASPNSIAKALAILEQINNDNPDTPEVLGLLAYTYLFASGGLNGLYVKARHQVPVYAERALLLQPSNFKALQALGYYYTAVSHLKHKADRVVNAMLRFHPDKQAAWRYRLYTMVIKASPCNDIRTVVNSIPKGVFKPARLKVIGQILDSCESSKPAEQIEQLWLAMKEHHSDKKQKILSRNLSLFHKGNDFMIEITQSRLNHRPGPRRSLAIYNVMLAMGDFTGANIIVEDLNNTDNNHWLKAANFTAQIYEQPPLLEFNSNDEQNYELLDSYTQLYMVANLVKNTIKDNANQNSQQTLLSYLNQVPEFDISMSTRSESITLMMAQRAAGKIKQSQQTAAQLSRQLTLYRNNSPQSYNFWDLGWFQLISDYYCSELCQSLPLEQLFEPSHRWWMDDIGIMRIALAPWSDEPMVKEYLHKIEQDRLRVKARLGI